MHEIWTDIHNCRLCDSSELHDVLDLGAQPPANTLRRSRDEVVPKAPLKLVFCGKCSAVQLTTTVDPEYLFSKYVWVTATSATAKAYSNIFCDEVLKRVTQDSPFVVEIASNDGTFLGRFKDKGSKVLGVDPAKNIADSATAAGIPTLSEFFDEKVADSILATDGPPRVVIARNVIPHVKEIHSIVKGLARLAGASGIVAIEFHYAKIIVDELHYDSIYHEHLFYFSLKSIMGLFERHGLLAFDAFASPISGGSLVLFFSRSASGQSNALRDLVETEREACLNELDKWREFGRASEVHARDLRELVASYTMSGPLVAYGASARSSTLMNFAGISNKEIECVIDRNPLKHGLLTPGTDIPIVPYEEGTKRFDSKAILLLAWNFENEIVNDLRSAGYKGDIIVPLPLRIRIR